MSVCVDVLIENNPGNTKNKTRKNNYLKHRLLLSECYAPPSVFAPVRSPTEGDNHCSRSLGLMAARPLLSAIFILFFFALSDRQTIVQIK